MTPQAPPAFDLYTVLSAYQHPDGKIFVPSELSEHLLDELQRLQELTDSTDIEEWHRLKEVEQAAVAMAVAVHGDISVTVDSPAVQAIMRLCGEVDFDSDVRWYSYLAPGHDLPERVRP